MRRELIKALLRYTNKKIILITGPRQVGKTTLSKSVFSDYDYLNYDAASDRTKMSQLQWNRKKEAIIFDELHKMPKWKQWLKGIYDTEGIPPAIIVTGSAKLDTYKKVGDSLAGRYFQYRLHPLDIKEVTQHSDISAQDAFNRILKFGGFPEPFLENKPDFYLQWQQSHLGIVLRQDMIELTNVRDIIGIETLLELLRSRVGGTVSYANLSEDLSRDQTTIKRWCELLENLHLIFKVMPYSQSMSRSLRKSPKYYFYDTGAVLGGEGPRLENMVACALLKELHFLNDTQGIPGKLYFLRTKDGKEIDFLIELERKPRHLIEVKWSDTSPSKHFNYFRQFLGDITCTQVVANLDRVFDTKDHIRVENAVSWLKEGFYSNFKANGGTL